jgi:TolA-binding protein
MADVIQQVTDANGKNFSVDVSKICDINGDLGDKASASITDSTKNRVQKVHDVEFVDQNGKAIDSMQLLKDMASGKTQVLALDVEMEATHSGKNHNYCIYYEDSMEKDAESFVNPFKKPMLKNHNDYSGEPLGRITQSWFGPSQLTDERSAIHLKARVTDQDAIPKFLDGRYGTVSIGGTMGTVTCNVCGKTILKDGKFKFCGHWRGESYKDQVCYWGAKDIEYHEVSTVNNPADDYAQIMKVTVVTDSDDKKDSKEESTMAGTNTDNKKAEDVKKTVCDMIDQLLGNGAAASTSDSSATPNDNNDGADEQPATATDAEQPKDDAQVADSQELEQLKQQLADANEKVSSLETELTETKDALAKAQEDLTAAQTEATDMKDKCMALATANKELVADSIIAKELVGGKVTEETKDARKDELMAKSMKELAELQKDSVEEKAPRTPAQVTSPVKVDDNNGDNGNADVNKETTDNNAAKKTVDDFAKDIVGKLLR